MTGQLLRLLPSVLDLLDKCERCSLPGRDVYHGEQSASAERFHAVPCGWCRRKTRRDDRYCCDNCRDLAAAQEERVARVRASRIRRGAL